MSAASQTRLFGVRVGIDPKWILGGLVVLAALLFWYNSRSGEETTQGVTQTAQVTTGAVVPRATTVKPTQRRAGSSSERATLRMRVVDATRGDVDPTLRLDRLSRLQAVAAPSHGRSLFEVGPASQQAATVAVPHTIIVPGRISSPSNPGPHVGLPPLTVNIPLKFYGFESPTAKADTKRGLFLEGDNVIVASEGELVDHRYLVVELTPTSARMEDVQVKQRQDLPIVPEAQAQQ
ncbi:MAG: hypothetical protein JOZ62_19080 [Acidobacteriaceae bacterium]|nr:hypothetical protein [Acidobacteriaceae bacterium]